MPRDRDPRKEKPEFSDDFIFSRLIGPKWHGYKSEGTRAGDQNNAPSNGNVVESGLSLGRFEGHHGSTQEGKDDGGLGRLLQDRGKADSLKFEGDPDKEPWTHISSTANWMFRASLEGRRARGLRPEDPPGLAGRRHVRDRGGLRGA